MTKTEIFAISRWRTAACLKIALSRYVSRELSNFDQFWYIDTNFHSGHANLTKNRNFSNWRWRTDAILKIVFGYISATYFGRFMQISEWGWRITCRYRSRDQKCNFRKFKMADGRHFENSFISIPQPRITHFDQFWYADTNFHSEHANLTKKNRNFSNSRWRTAAILKIALSPYLSRLLSDIDQIW